MRERDRFNEFKLVIFFQKNQLEIVRFQLSREFQIFKLLYIIIIYCSAIVQRKLLFDRIAKKMQR